MASKSPLYRLIGTACQVEVFDAAVMVLQVGRQPAVSEEVIRLARLRDEGLLTDEEFAAAKRRVIGPGS